MLCHFEKGEEAGAGGSPRQRGPPGPQSFPGHSGDALRPEEVGGELWMGAEIFPTCRVGWHGGAKHYSFF